MLTLMSKVDQIVAPIMRKELPSVSLSPQHPKYLWYLVPALAYLAAQGKIDDLQITTITSPPVPEEVIDLAGVVDSPKKIAIPSPPPTPVTPAIPSPAPVPDFTQHLLVWVNQQPPEKCESLARAVHLPLITAQGCPPVSRTRVFWSSGPY